MHIRCGLQHKRGVELTTPLALREGGEEGRGHSLNPANAGLNQGIVMSTDGAGGV